MVAVADKVDARAALVVLAQNGRELGLEYKFVLTVQSVCQRSPLSTPEQRVPKRATWPREDIAMRNLRMRNPSCSAARASCLVVPCVGPSMQGGRSGSKPPFRPSNSPFNLIDAVARLVEHLVEALLRDDLLRCSQDDHRVGADVVVDLCVSDSARASSFPSIRQARLSMSDYKRARRTTVGSHSCEQRIRQVGPHSCEQHIRPPWRVTEPTPPDAVASLASRNCLYVEQTLIRLTSMVMICTGPASACAPFQSLVFRVCTCFNAA